MSSECPHVVQGTGSVLAQVQGPDAGLGLVLAQGQGRVQVQGQGQGQGQGHMSLEGRLQLI